MPIAHLTTEERYRVISRVGHVLNSSLDLNVVLPRLAQELKAIFPLDHVALCVINPDGKTYSWTNITTDEGGVALPEENVPLEGGTLGWLIEHRSDKPYVLYEDLERERPFAEDEIVFKRGIRSGIRVPLEIGNTIFGDLAVASLTPRRFTEEMAGFLADMAPSIATAVANARAYAQLEASRQDLYHETVLLRDELRELHNFEELIGTSGAIRKVQDLIRRAAPTEATVLILGETGTGKELIARAIHNLSPDHDQPYQVVDCTRFPEGMIEGELFGHVKGAFTGAVADKMGLLELADGGSVFLDEIADLPLSLQAKLLRVLEEGEVRPVGGTRSKKIDVRFIAATNQDLEARVSSGEFRKDLFYRLNVVTLRVPPLRDRVEDIPLLARHFLVRFAREFGKAVTELHPSAVTDLVVYTWPGNIRELRNVIERAVMLCTGDRLTSKELALLLPSDAEGSAAVDSLAGEEYLGLPYSEAKEKVLEAFTLRYIKGKLAAHGGNVTRAAQDSGVPRQHFQQIMKRYLKDDA